MSTRESFNPESYELDKSFRLTRFTELKGTGCKVPQDVLQKLLESLQENHFQEDEQFLGAVMPRLGMYTISLIQCHPEVWSAVNTRFPRVALFGVISNVSYWKEEFEGIRACGWQLLNYRVYVWHHTTVRLFSRWLRISRNSFLFSQMASTMPCGFVDLLKVLL